MDKKGFWEKKEFYRKKFSHLRNIVIFRGWKYTNITEVNTLDCEIIDIKKHRTKITIPGLQGKFYAVEYSFVLYDGNEIDFNGELSICMN